MTSSTISTTDHRPYNSLEQLRLSQMSKLLGTYSHDVIVMEKIHGSNIQYTFTWNGTTWDYQIGSRKRWVSNDEKFNNVQKIFKELLPNLIALCDELRNDEEDVVIRFYGEVFGGKYGGETAPGAIVTQREVNYCSHNDVAFFDIVRNGSTMPIVQAIDMLENHDLKVTPVIYRGNFANFAKSFNVNEFKSVVSQRFYGLPYLDTPKGTEGVIVRTMHEDVAEGDELLVMKWKQDWAVENRRVNQRTPAPVNNQGDIINAAIDMINQNRIESYVSKHIQADLTNPCMMALHVKTIVADTMDDVNKEFPNAEYPELNRRLINKKISQIAFPMFKEYLRNLEMASMTPEMRIRNLDIEGNKLSAEAYTLSQRLEKIQTRLAILG